jgi:thiol-disulfide isomerase/thioredoxin
MPRFRFLAAAALAGAMGVSHGSWAQDHPATPPMLPTASALPYEGAMPSMDGATTWLNSSPLAVDALRGKVVVVQFWTYSCINWLRTMPYVRAWQSRYKDQGLVVIGVHSPEFGFEKSVANVRRAADQMNVAYPIAIDSDHTIWDAFSNEYWPALYFVDTRGQIRHHQFGEGDYELSELVIRQLLAEAGQQSSVPGPVIPDARGAEVAADWRNLESPETYLGYERATLFASPGGFAADTRHVYAAPRRLPRNGWAFAGDWTAKKEATSSNLPGARIALRFHARDVHLVMGPATAGKPVRFRVLMDGRPPGVDHGVDIDAQGYGVTGTPRLYQLIRQSGAVTDRQFEIQFLDAGAQVFSFTFG